MSLTENHYPITNSSSATEAGEDRLNHAIDLNASLCSLERVVRPAPTERLNGNPRGLRRGNDGRRRRKRVNGGTGWPGRRTPRRKNGNTLDDGGTGTSLPSKNPTRETQGLTNPSSATGAGEVKRGRTKGRTASRCSLERMVRRVVAVTSMSAHGLVRSPLDGQFRARTGSLRPPCRLLPAGRRGPPPARHGARSGR